MSFLVDIRLSLQTLIVAFSLPQKITIYKTHISSLKRISERDLGRPRGRQGLLDDMEATQDHFDSRVRWGRLADGSGEREAGRAGRGISIAPSARNLSFLAPDSNDSPRRRLPLPPSPLSSSSRPLEREMEDGLERASERAMMPSRRRRDPILRAIRRGQSRPRSEVVPPRHRQRRICKEHEKQSGPFVVANIMPRCRYATRNRLPTATWYFSLKGRLLLCLPCEAFAPCAAGWHRRAGNGLPFARCQILPKVDGRDGGRREERNGEATTAMEEEEEEAKMMERQTSGRKEGGRDFSHGLAP